MSIIIKEKIIRFQLGRGKGAKGQSEKRIKISHVLLLKLCTYLPAGRQVCLSHVAPEQLKIIYNL